MPSLPIPAQTPGDVRALHDAWLEMTGRAEPRHPLFPAHVRRYRAFLKAGRTLEDYRRLIAYVQDLIRQGKRQPPSLRLNLLLDVERCADDFAEMAEAKWKAPWERKRRKVQSREDWRREQPEEAEPTDEERAAMAAQLADLKKSIGR